MIASTVTLSERAIKQLAAHITAHCDGVKTLTDKSGRALKWQEKGIYIIKSKDKILLEIYIICRYGANTVKLCDTIIKTIKETLSGTVPEIGSINIKVMGVQK